ncbi:hypothetical protein GGF46_001754 [Coemansia sp. RSA 552]|nr:hypothetical protein GGF46_001754 [Coemansia sp. RSA 552]
MAGHGSVAVTSQSPAKPSAPAIDTPPNAPSAPDTPSPDEREDMINQAEWGFRKWLRETGSQPGGYVMYPSTRQIHKSLQTLSKTLADVDLSDIAS